MPSGRQLEHKASHDPLTDLLNQASFYENLGRALARARRQGSKVALLFVDLDDFKPINDSLGHQSGDQVLAHVAERLKGCLRESDTAARIGGDEVAVLLEDVADISEALRFIRAFPEATTFTLGASGTPVVYNRKHRHRLGC